MKMSRKELDELIEVLTEAAHQTIRAAPDDKAEWASPGEKWFELFLKSIGQQVTDED